jgi:hypothetical protein
VVGLKDDKGVVVLLVAVVQIAVILLEDIVD